MYNLVIGIPHRDSQAYNAFWKSVCIAKKPDNWCIINTERKRDDDGRNYIVREALKDTRVTHILFLDDDHIISEDSIMKSLKFDKDIVGGLYFDRAYPHYSNVFKVDDEGYMCKWSGIAFVGLQELDAVGTGFMLVKRKVFEKMKFPWFKWDEQVDGLKIDESQVIGPDVAFCVKAKKLGFGIFCNTDDIVKHIGNESIIDENCCFGSKQQRMFSEEYSSEDDRKGEKDRLKQIEKDRLEKIS